MNIFLFGVFSVSLKRHTWPGDTLEDTPDTQMKDHLEYLCVNLYEAGLCEQTIRAVF